MPVYTYKNLSPDGVATSNRIEAPSEAQARIMLQQRGERVMGLREMSSVKTQGGSTSRGKKPSGDEMAGTIRQLAIMVRAGVPLVEGLRGLSEQVQSPVLREVLQQITLDVSQGASLSNSFEKHPSVFPQLAVEMAKVAEAGGNLAESLGRLADHIENGAEIRRKVKAALAYPLVVCIISFLTTIVMMTFIVPRFSKLFDQMGAKIPWTTRMMMNASHIMITYWYLFIIGVLISSYLIRRYARSKQGRHQLDAVVLKLPLVGDIVNKIVLSRVVASMATLLQSGVPMVKTLEISSFAANNEIVKEALARAAKCVAEGTATSEALRVAGVFPPIVLQMAASGEKTGELPGMLGYICELYNKETDAKVKSLTSVIEPILIVLLGVIVGTIAISVIVPIYSLVGSVK